MNRIRIAIVAVVAIGACHPVSPRPGAGWQQVSGRLLGATGPAFTMLIPDRLAAADKGNDTDGALALLPAVIVRQASAMPASIDQMIGLVGSRRGDVIVRRDAIDHGFIVTSRSDDSTYWRVDLLRQRGEVVASCFAFQRGEHALGGDVRAVLETMCLSVRIE